MQQNKNKTMTRKRKIKHIVFYCDEINTYALQFISNLNVKKNLIPSFCLKNSFMRNCLFLASSRLRIDSSLENCLLFIQIGQLIRALGSEKLNILPTVTYVFVFSLLLIAFANVKIIRKDVACKSGTYILLVQLFVHP